MFAYCIYSMVEDFKKASKVALINSIEEHILNYINLVQLALRYDEVDDMGRREMADEVLDLWSAIRFLRRDLIKENEDQEDD